MGSRDTMMVIRLFAVCFVFCCPQRLVTAVAFTVSSKTPATGSEPKLDQRNTTRPCEAKYAGQTPTHTRCLPDSPAAVAVRLTARDKHNIVELHNKLRASVVPTATNMEKMVWDEKLANTAQKLAMRCAVDHDDNHREPDYPGVPIGQNLGAGHSSFKGMIEEWYSEKGKRKYVHGRGYVKGLGHYVQVVYHASARVGCGEAKCPSSGFRRLRVCNYATRLDTGHPPYEKGPSAERCPDHRDETGKLCDCQGKICFHGGSLDVSTCQCRCPERWKGDKCEERNCPIEDGAWSCRHRYTAEDCGKRGHVENPEYCPILCAICPKPCGDKKCLHGGTLDLHTCRCHCVGVFTGDTCEVCPEQDGARCGLYRKDDCSSVWYKYYTTTNCPILCGICPLRS